MIYADNAATTKLDIEAFEAMKPWLLDEFGNASQPYSFARNPKKTLAESREIIASCIGAKPEEVFFTSGGTESDNWVIKGSAFSDPNYHATITSSFEHHAVLHSCETIERLGYPVAYLAPGNNGIVTPETLEGCITPNTRLVSIMYANNEIGSIQPIKKLCAIAHRNGALFHTDAVQGFLKLPFTPKGLGVDLLTISGHKIHAPKGIGALYIRSGLRIDPMILGGGQENGLRSGTEPTAQIAALAAACAEGKQNLGRDIAHMRELKAYTLEQLSIRVPEAEQIGRGEAPHILALTLPGYKAEVLVRVLGDMGVCVSAGSACHRGRPSHVYAAMGLDKAHREGSFRVSFSGDTQRVEVDAFLDVLTQAKAKLFTSMS